MNKDNKFKCLFLEDDPYFLKAIDLVIKEEIEITKISHVHELNQIRNLHQFDLAIIDLNLDKNLEGIKAIKMIKNLIPEIIVLSSHDDDEVTEEVYNLGISNFLTKKYYSEYLPPIIKKSISRKNKNTIINDFLTKKFISDDEKIKGIINSLFDIQIDHNNILITGETGSGKSYLAKLIHDIHSEQNSPFIHLNCSEFSEELLESELFGHLKGSFSGATNNYDGKLKLADRGTLFLDEVNSMSAKMQAKLLTAIETKSFYPVGGKTKVKSQFNIISASNCSLSELMESILRTDLVYRLKGIHIDLPPLRDRIFDIPLLIKHFVAQSGRKIVLKNSAITQLMNYHWPGNTRELKNLINNFIYSSLGIIDDKKIQVYLDSPSPLTNSPSYSEEFSDDKSLFIQNNYQVVKNNGMRFLISELEKEIVKVSLSQNNNQKIETIKELKISNSAFYRIYNHLSELSSSPN